MFKYRYFINNIKSLIIDRDDTTTKLNNIGYFNKIRKTD